jgi:hypothetical protein
MVTAGVDSEYPKLDTHPRRATTIYTVAARRHDTGSRHTSAILSWMHVWRKLDRPSHMQQEAQVHGYGGAAVVRPPRSWIGRLLGGAG